MGMEASSEIFGVDVLNTQSFVSGNMREVFTDLEEMEFISQNLQNQWLSSHNWCGLGVTGEVKLEIHISGISLSVAWVFLFI